MTPLYVENGAVDRHHNYKNTNTTIYGMLHSSIYGRSQRCRTPPIKDGVRHDIL